jgi:hypothetical protein
VKGKAAIRRGFVTAVGFVALAAVPVLALNSLATADTGAGAAGADGGTGRPGLADTVRQCLAEQGVTPPARPADGTRPTLSPEQRQALRQAAAACGLPLRPGARFRPPLTDAQRQCLAEQGVTLPARPADGIRPTLSPEQREALRQAAAACGLPGHRPGAGGGAGPAPI